MSSVLAFLLFTSVLFLPRIGLLDLALISVATFTGLIFLIYRRHSRHLYLHIMIWLIFAFFSVSLLSGINGWFQFSEDGSFFFAQKNLRLLLMVLSLSMCLSRLPLNTESLIKVASACLSIHVFMIFFQIIFPESKEYIILFMTPDFGDWSRYRATGLANSHDIAGMYVVYLSIFVTYFLENSVGKKSKFFWLVMLALCFLATMLTARVALISFLAFCLIHFGLVRRAAFRASILASCSAIVLGTWVFFKILISWRPEYGYAVQRSFDYLRMIRESGNLLDSFLDTPTDDFLSFILGTGYPPYTLYGAKGDLGYGHPLWGTGIIGLSLVLFCYGLIAILNQKKLVEKRFSERWILALLVLISFLASLKGPYLFGRGVFELIIIVWISVNLRGRLVTGKSLKQDKPDVQSDPRISGHSTMGVGF